MSQQETFMDKYIFEGFSYQWPYNIMFVLSYLVQQHEDYVGKKKLKKKKKKRKETGLDASLVGIFPIFPTKFIMNTMLTIGDVNGNRL